MAIINKELDCISSHSNKKNLDWNDVCYSSNNQDQDALRERLIAKAMEREAKNQQASTEDIALEDTGPDANNAPAETTISAPQKMEQPYAISQEPADTAHNERLDNFANYRNQREKHFTIGLESYLYNYKEPSLGVELDGKNPFYGAYMNYSFRPASSEGLFDDVIDVYKADISYSHGYANYSGSGTHDNEPNSVLEFRGMMGKDLILDDRSRITPYSGLGFRYLRNDSGGTVTSTGAAGYDRESHYLYLPLGVEFTTPIVSGWTLMPSAEMDFLLLGWQLSHLTQAGYFQDVKNNQRNGYGIRGSIKLVKEGDRMDYVIEPFIRHWYIGDSDLNDDGAFVWQEPRNKTTEYGVRLGAQF